MSKVKSIITKGLMIAALAFAGVGIALPMTASAADCDPESGITGIDCIEGETDLVTNLFGESGTVTRVINIVLFIVALVAVIMLIYGGIQYVLSSGDSGKVTTAKNTILYAIVGIVVALLAYAIVNFVIGNVTEDRSATSYDSQSACQQATGKSCFQSSGKWVPQD